MLENFNQIKVTDPADIIIQQIRSLITSGQLNPGDKLPSERKLAEKFGVGRSHVRDAIRKLEFYGILKTFPQSGTFISGLGINALQGLLSDVLGLEGADFRSLVETRIILEINGAAFAAQRRTEADLSAIQKTLEAYERKVAEGATAVEEDLFFHLKIAEASKNKVLKSLMLIITPDILKSYAALEVCKNEGIHKAVEEHQQIFQFIIEQNVQGVRKAMQIHLKDVQEFSQTGFPHVSGANGVS
ncbi:MAG: FadR family transcriptional regulator [Bacteroidetes bacterium]|nr:MAG: FadR family transcriptional regulator [Bacteroidota bacterium]